MQNLSDDDLDKLFKRAAEQQQTQFDPADWDNMASRLDANKKPWLNYYTGTGSIVLLGVVIWLGWFITKPNQADSSPSASVDLVKETASIENKSIDNLERASSSTAKAQSSSVEKVENASVNQSALLEISSVTRTNQKVTDKVGQTDERNGESNLTGIESSSIINSEMSEVSQSLLLSNPAGQSNQTVSTNVSQLSITAGVGSNYDARDVEKNKSNELMHSNSDLNTAVGVSKTVVVVSDEESMLKKQHGSLEQNSNQHEFLEGNRTSIVNATDSVVEGVDDSEVASKNMNLKNGSDDPTSKQQATFSRFAVRATIAPDFSSEQFNSISKMGFNYGLVIEYFLNKNFSIETGALWSRKYYSAVDVEYNGYHADRAYGDCRMWDIPLNVNYYFTPAKQYSFFAKAGLSSYLMNEENYDYEVDTNYGTKTYTSQVIKENNEWFKTLNVSVGLQKQISSRFVIQVEPFVKVPLEGVGEGNISLASFGGFFSVRYSFLTLKK